MPEVELSPGLNTKEDAAKIAQALWAEAVKRGWESEYRDIIENTTRGAAIPAVGNVSVVIATSKGLNSLGETGVVLAPVVDSTRQVNIFWDHSMPVVGEDGACVCPDPESPDEGVADVKRKVLEHARAKVEAQTSWQPLRFGPVAAGAEPFTAECSSVECRNK